MAAIHIKIDWKALERYSDFTFAPGDADAVTIDGSMVIKEWCNAECDPGVTVGQAETLRDLLGEGVIVKVDENGDTSIVAT